jgi:hypothetical protein
MSGMLGESAPGSCTSLRYVASTQLPRRRYHDEKRRNGAELLFEVLSWMNA